MISEKRLLHTFLDLIAINAPAKHERPVADYLKRILKSYSLREDAAGKKVGGNCGNLLVCVPGDRRRPVMCSAHMDTVRPTTGIRPILGKGVIRTDGKTILGADDRAGIAIILELLKHLAESGRPHPPLELVFTVAEEVGLQGAKQIRSDALKSSKGYVLDSSLPVGMAVNRSVTIHRMKILAMGRSAHSGVNPERGINAISIAAKALSKLPMGRIGDDTTLNVGVISGGHAFNIVPDETRMELELRSASPPVLEKWVRRVKGAFAGAAKQLGGKVKIDAWVDFKLFRISPRDPVVRAFQAGAEGIGIKPRLCQYGGGSDANVFNALGIPCLVLGLGYHLPHTNQERITIGDLVLGTKLLASILEHCH